MDNGTTHRHMLKSTRKIPIRPHRKPVAKAGLGFTRAIEGLQVNHSFYAPGMSFDSARAIIRRARQRTRKPPILGEFLIERERTGVRVFRVLKPIGKAEQIPIIEAAELMPGFYWVRIAGAWEIATRADGVNWVAFGGQDVLIDNSAIGPRIAEPDKE